MLPIRCEKFYTPPSSPDSLSASWPNSSPPPSPKSEPFYLNYDDELEFEEAPVTRATDPLAGSYNANRAKRVSEASSARHSPNKKPRHLYKIDFQENISCSTRTTKPAFSPPQIDPDASIWEEALEKAFDTGIRSIDLSYVPVNIMSVSF